MATKAHFCCTYTPGRDEDLHTTQMQDTTQEQYIKHQEEDEISRKDFLARKPPYIPPNAYETWETSNKHTEYLSILFHQRII